MRVLEYDSTNGNSYVNLVMINNTRYYIIVKEMFDQISNIVENMENLGISGKDVGTHSIRAALAMALYLMKRPTTTIMLLGRWKSTAFLGYVRRQIQEFAAGVSVDMVKNEHFFTIPNLNEDVLMHMDRNPNSLANTVSINGPNASTTNAQQPALHIWH